MTDNVHLDETVDNTSYAGLSVYEHEYDNCTWMRCDFSSTQFLSCKFNGCLFDGCNLSMTGFSASLLSGAQFINCKVMGVKFNHCSDFIFEVAFVNCILDYSSFEKRKMAKTVFETTSLKGVDFAQADLRKARFVNADLDEAIFYNTNLQEADLSTAFNYIIDPDQNIIKKARFSKDGLHGLLNKYNIIIE